MNSKIIIICGDPNSINSEIIFKTWKEVSKLQKERITLIGNFQLLHDHKKAKKLQAFPCIPICLQLLPLRNQEIRQLGKCAFSRGEKVCLRCREDIASP